ncbi:MAG: serine protease [Rhodobacterales bacterium]|nr:serine protease [Rhodobacterales bacterium]
MTRIFTAFFLTAFISFSGLVSGSGGALAQDQDIAWVQIESQPSLASAQASIRSYSAKLADVNGFSLGGGWYGIALGPYTSEDAAEVLRVYRSEGSIPRDAFIAFSVNYKQQFWPIGANLLNLELAAQPEPADPENQAEPETSVAVQDRDAPDETKRQARQSEALLNRDERKDLQRLLQWAGFYTSAIDGAFGRGTRGSMAAWQEANNYESTGILTTRQRSILLDQYNAILDGLGMDMVVDTAAGIEMMMPTGVVKFDKYESPFAHYSASGDLAAKVLLISQTGDQNTLFGLYDIMQTLEIVPKDGERNRGDTAFTLVGENAQMISHTEVSLRDGTVKGFTLIWPAGDEERRTRLLAEMKASFGRIDGVLDPAAGSDEAQSIDLVSGLEIRRPKMSRSGFYVDQNGTVVTALATVGSCSKITIEDDIEAEVVASDNTLGIAVLRPLNALVPVSVAVFQQSVPRLQSQISVAGYSYEGVLGAPTMTFGVLADLKGLRGEATLKRLALAALPGDTGGPVFDAGGAVLGMLLPADTNGRTLPDGVSFSANSDAIQAVLNTASLGSQTTDILSQIAPEDLAISASGMTVLVSCW